MKLRAIILGCGSSGGVPRIGGPDGRGAWGDCDPKEPRNRRKRSSIVVQRADDHHGWDAPALTTILIDTAPELRLQLTDNGIGHVDAVFWTHDHADQAHGIDDLRAIYLHTRERVPAYLDPLTAPDLKDRFQYCFEEPPGSGYPAILDQRDCPSAGETALVNGPSGAIPVMPFLCEHGQVPSLGFLFGGPGGLAYSPDVNALGPESLALLEGTGCWVVDALRYRPHVSHAHLGLALEWLAQVRARHGVLTNLHVDMDYATVSAETPAHVEPAFDGMVIELTV